MSQENAAHTPIFYAGTSVVEFSRSGAFVGTVAVVGENLRAVRVGV